MIRDKVLFLIILILTNNSLACEKEDFLTFVSAEKNKCIALQTIGEIKQNCTFRKFQFQSLFNRIWHLPKSVF